MSPQRNNRSILLEGTLRCLERLPPGRVTSRAIASESGANIASIAYHFGSKDELVTAAVVEGLDRWLADIASGLEEAGTEEPAVRLQRAFEIIDATRERHEGLARNFLGALARAPHEPRIRELLTEGFRRTRPAVAAILGLGDDQAGEDAGGLLLAMFDGLLIQALLDPSLSIEGKRMERAQVRLRKVLPSRPARG
jgi:AcrR family transcriptional regulator